MYMLCLQATNAVGSTASPEMSTPPNYTDMERISEGQEVSFMCFSKHYKNLVWCCWDHARAFMSGDDRPHVQLSMQG